MRACFDRPSGSWQSGARWSAAAGAGSVRSRSATRRILLVEDEFLTAALLGDELAEAGFRIVGPFGTLASARAAAGTEDFDLALLDVNLRGELVYPLAEDLVAHGVPVVLVSGYTAADLPAALRGLPRLSKPHDSDALVRTIERELRSRG
jgi:DNA-binding response OmpR family regulator